jgi:hypothetical protein
MWNLSSKTQVDKAFTLSELFKRCGADRSIKADAKNVESVVLRYVLNENTIGFKPDTIKEIYVFLIEMSAAEIPFKFIGALDQIIRLQTVFVLHCGKDELITTAAKSRNGGKLTIGRYMSTDWSSIKDPISIPSDEDTLDDLYLFLLSGVNKYPPFKTKDFKESVSEYLSRYNLLKRLDFQIGKTQQAVDHEIQSKKRFEYNDRLKEYQKERDSLLSEREYEYGKIKDAVTEFVEGKPGKN